MNSQPPRSKDSIALISQEVEQCVKCPRLVSWRNEIALTKRKAYKDEQYWGAGVPGFGDESADVMVVGLAPGAHGANRTGRVFTGDSSGDWLYAALHRAGFANQPTSTDRGDGLELNNTFITMPVRCVPPKNKPIAAEVKNCASYLERELSLIKPKVILCLGAISFSSIQKQLEVTPRVKFSHGAEVEVDEITLLACYHVSQQNTFTGRLTTEMLDDIFDRVKSIID